MSKKKSFENALNTEMGITDMKLISWHNYKKLGVLQEDFQKRVKLMDHITTEKSKDKIIERDYSKHNFED